MAATQNQLTEKMAAGQNWMDFQVFVSGVSSPCSVLYHTHFAFPFVKNIIGKRPSLPWRTEPVRNLREVEQEYVEYVEIGGGRCTSSLVLNWTDARLDNRSLYLQLEETVVKNTR